MVIIEPLARASSPRTVASQHPPLTPPFQPQPLPPQRELHLSLQHQQQQWQQQQRARSLLRPPLLPVRVFYLLKRTMRRLLFLLLLLLLLLVRALSSAAHRWRVLCCRDRSRFHQPRFSLKLPRYYIPSRFDVASSSPTFAPPQQHGA